MCSTTNSREMRRPSVELGNAYRPPHLLGEREGGYKGRSSPKVILHQSAVEGEFRRGWGPSSRMSEDVEKQHLYGWPAHRDNEF